jgi:hypothetical protein
MLGKCLQQFQLTHKLFRASEIFQPPKVFSPPKKSCLPFCDKVTSILHFSNKPRQPRSLGGGSASASDKRVGSQNPMHDEPFIVDALDPLSRTHDSSC